MSLVAQYDEMVRSMKLLTDPVEEQFLQFMEGLEEVQQKRRELEREVQRLQEHVSQSQKTTKNLEMKLRNARHMLDLEKGRRIAAENEKNNMAGQILQAIEMLGQGQVMKTKERLQQLQHSFTSQDLPSQALTAAAARLHDQHSPTGPLSTITEDYDSVDTIQNLSQMNMTEEDDLEESRLRSGRAFKRKSSPDRLDRSPDGGHKRHSGGKSGGDGKENKHSLDSVPRYIEEEEGVKGGPADTQPSAPPYLGVTAAEGVDLSGEKSSLEASREEYTSPLKKPPRTPAPPPPTPAAWTRPSVMSPSFNYDIINLGTPVTPQPYTTPTHTPHTPVLRNHPSASKVNGRTHAFVVKSSFKIENCQPCGKRIKFAKTCLKCRDCRAICHTECREQVPLPCVPTANTPNTTNKGQMGTIADYVPRSQPMVPALVVHCTNEVENRGLTEVGIYRLCGSEKEIRELKDQFLRCRGLPNLSQVDIHVISGTLKLFLRGLKEPLITNLLWNDFTAAAEKPDTQDANASLYQAICELPQPNRDTLAWIIAHLQRVAECPECKMPTMNLAKVFGPTLVGYSAAEPDPATMVAETRLQHQVMEKLLEISSDYWHSFIQVSDENTQPGGGGGQPSTPDLGGTMLGGMPLSNARRRRSQIFRTPMQARNH